jgi:hypothetical protein
MAKPKVKPKAKKKAAPKKKVTLENVLSEIKRVHERLGKLERDIRALRGDVQSHTPTEKTTDTETESPFQTLPPL